MLLAEPIARTFGRKPTAKPSKQFTPSTVGALVLVAFTVLRVLTPKPIADTDVTPVSTIAHVPAELARQPVFNQYELGGFLIFSSIRPFIDGRADVYGSDFVTNYFESVSDGDKLQSTLQRHRVTWAISSAGHPLDRAFEMLPGWTLLYRDRYAAVYVRE
jgi:hypothetical protein